MKFSHFEGQPTNVVHEVAKAYIQEVVGTLKAARRTEISAKELPFGLRHQSKNGVAAGEAVVRRTRMSLTSSQAASRCWLY